MAYLPSRGDPASRMWLIVDHPYPSDITRGYLFSGGLGFVWQKMLEEAGLDIQDFYIVARRPDTDDPKSYASIESALYHFKPPFILMASEVGMHYLPEMKPRDKDDTFKTQLNKYCGSLLSCARFGWPHYTIPVYAPDKLVQDWRERNVSTYVDLQKLRDEVDFWKQHGTLQPLPSRSMSFSDFDFGQLCGILDKFRNSPLLSVDIETVYPKVKSAFYPHPGYPVTIGIADSSTFGISFNLFRESPAESRVLFRELDSLFSNARILGQNFFNFDLYFLESLGFSINKNQIVDTMIRHHNLWPELSHKLQFMTRQYTREPYYKDEGKHWSMKHMNQLRRYNCLDVCVTYEVYEAQESEFNDRPHLR